MDINLGIVDQRVAGIVERHGDVLGADAARARARAFVALGVATHLGVDIEDALRTLTDGEGDLGVDALHVMPGRGQIQVVLFQVKYHSGSKRGVGAFPTNELQKIATTVSRLFDPGAEIRGNEQLVARVDEVRSFLRDGAIPDITVVCVSNGRPWDPNGQHVIDASGLPADQVRFEHLDAERIVGLLQAVKPVDDELRFSGAALVEDDFAFRRVIVGRLPVRELARLMETHGERLLEGNIRRFLGRQNRVNRAIASTLASPETRPDFYFLNNGVTLICGQFRYNAIQKRDWIVQVKGLQIVNGGQTAATIRSVLARQKEDAFDQTYVLVRLYELPDEQREFVAGVTLATNNQSPVDLRDLRANDPVQRRIELILAEAGITYLRKRVSPRPSGAVTPEDLAEVLLCTVRDRPEWARARKAEHFGELYDFVFRDDLSTEDVVRAARWSRWLTEVLALVETETKGAPLGRVPWHPRHFLLWRFAKDAAARAFMDGAFADLPLGRSEVEPRVAAAVQEAWLVGLLVGESPKPTGAMFSSVFRRGKAARDTWEHLRERTASALHELRQSSQAAREAFDIVFSSVLPPEQLLAVRRLSLNVRQQVLVRVAYRVFPDLDFTGLEHLIEDPSEAS